MMKRFLKWLCSDLLSDEYLKGWGHGVDQHRKEPESCDHHHTIDYWGEKVHEEHDEMELDELEQNPYGMG